jgi:hypothetical protein
MRQAARHRLSERDLHEYVADVEGHDSQVTGVVGYFYAMYRAEVLARVNGLHGRDMLEVGCGEGMMFDGAAAQPVLMDVSVRRVSREDGKGACSQALTATISVCDRLSAGPGRGPRAPASRRLLAEARRVKPGGVVTAAQRLDDESAASAAGEILIRYPDHLMMTTPKRMPLAARIS